MDIIVSLLKPVLMDNGELGVEWTAGGRVPNGPDVAIGGTIPVDWAWSRATFRAALQARVRAAIADAYGTGPITSGRFLVLELLG